jgi:hypothetical protein
VQVNVVNLDNFFESNQQCEPAVINLSKQPMEILPTTPITLINIRIKRKRCNVFLLVIETTTKNNKVMVKVMDYFNITQLEIEDCRNKLREQTFVE